MMLSVHTAQHSKHNWYLSTKIVLKSKNIIDRIKLIHSFNADNQVAEWLGISKQAFSAAKTRNSIDLNKVFQKMRLDPKTRNVSLHWIATGEGPVEVADSAEPGLSQEIEGLIDQYQSQANALSNAGPVLDASLEMLRSSIRLIEAYINAVESFRPGSEG